jgi:cob(I)alamin adenosyltransferase
MTKKKIKKKLKKLKDDFFYLDDKVKKHKYDFLDTARIQTQKIEKLEQFVKSFKENGK